MRLFIAEKPSLGRSIAAALPQPHVKGENCIFCGKDDVVTWAAGHILTLYEPQDYDPQHGQWKLENIPHIPQEWKYKTRPDADSLHKTIKKYLDRADSVVNAGDADREGQLLIDEILDYYDYKGKAFRLLITDNNVEAIQAAIAGMKPNEHYKNLSEAGQARAKSDWLLGLNMTRLYTLLAKQNNNYGGSVLSIGRVQTPVLGLIVRRDAEVENFVSKPFFSILASFSGSQGSFTANWQPGDEQEGLDEKKRLVDKNIADAIVTKLVSVKQGTVINIEKKRIKSAAPLPYSLPALQIDASKTFGLSPSETLEITQKLYEAGIVTYPRSDCQYLPESKYSETSQIIAGVAKSLSDFADLTGKLDPGRKHKAFDDKKVTEHFAIIPTGKTALLKDKPKDVYQLIALRFLALFWPDDYEYYDAKIEVDLGGERFKASGKEIIKEGWRVILKNTVEAEAESDKDSDIKNMSLPELDQGQSVDNEKVHIKGKKTTPPDRYTEATLLAAMGNIHNYVHDEEIKKVLKENDGLGTAATQADIINKLYLRTYTVKKGKHIISTDKGRTLIHLLPDILTLPDLTALWEKQMKSISSGEKSLPAFISEVEQHLQDLISTAKQEKEKIVFAVEGTQTKKGKMVECFVCGKPLRFIDSAKGKFWACTNQECKKTYSDNKGKPQKPIQCPKCNNKPLRKMIGKNGAFWVCECGYTASDDKGKPQATRKCKCGSIQKKNLSKNGKVYWKCVGCQDVTFE